MKQTTGRQPDESRQAYRARARRQEKARLQALKAEISKKRIGGSAAVTAEELLDV